MLKSNSTSQKSYYLLFGRGFSKSKNGVIHKAISNLEIFLELQRFKFKIFSKVSTAALKVLLFQPPEARLKKLIFNIYRYSLALQALFTYFRLYEKQHLDSGLRNLKIY